MGGTEPLVAVSLASQGLCPPAGHLCSVHPLLKSLPQILVLSPGMTKTCGHPRQEDHWSLPKLVLSRCSSFIQWIQGDTNFPLMKMCFFNVQNKGYVRCTEHKHIFLKLTLTFWELRLSCPSTVRREDGFLTIPERKEPMWI